MGFRKAALSMSNLDMQKSGSIDVLPCVPLYSVGRHQSPSARSGEG